MTRARWSAVLLLALWALAPGPHAAANAEWPAKPVTLVVPFPPGGSTDPLARLLGRKLADALGQSFVVENHAGASGSIGAALAARAPADGYTFLFSWDTHAVNPALQPDLPFDTLRDLDPVMLLCTVPMVIATLESKPYRNLADVIRAAQAAPGTLTYGTAGSGSRGHLALAQLQRLAGFELVHVPYKGGGPLAQDALGGHIELAVGTLSTLATHLKSGPLRALAVSSPQRAPLLPDVPTLAEQGYPAASAVSWWGIFAPAGTPAPIVERFHAELSKALALPDVRANLEGELGMQLVGGTPERLREFLAEEMQRWGEVVRENKIAAD
jgi:tripartite-type tricarboxylate transporter receptor subunit TctC